MTQLVWGAFGQRFYETGVDRGVLFVGTQPGVAWGGLISVNETPSGGEAKPYYLDGMKYLNLSAAEEYEASISALSSPAEFAPCDGTVSIHNGLFATQQRRQSFGFSYRTLIGNDANGNDHAYKIHIVYNALAAPAQKTNRSFGSNSDPTALVWSITTKPPPITGYKRTAHLVIDSRTANPDILAEVEELLYGTESEDSTLPTPDEIVAIFAA